MSWFQSLFRSWKRRKDLRLYPRIPAYGIPIKIFLKDQDQPQVGEIENWSQGGLFIKTDNPPLEDTIIDLEFSLGKKQKSFVQLQAQVISHRFDKQTQRKNGMGVMFTDFTQSGLIILRELLLNVSADD